jgi:hypothetical protein
MRYQRLPISPFCYAINIFDADVISCTVIVRYLDGMKPDACMADCSQLLHLQSNEMSPQQLPATFYFLISQTPA